VEDSAPLVSLSDTNIEFIGEIDLLWFGRKRFFRRTVERLTFLVVPSSNTAVTGPIIGAISLNTLGLLEMVGSRRRAFGASLRKFESKSKVSEEVLANRRRYAEIKAENVRLLKEGTPLSSDNDAPQRTENPQSRRNVSKP